ncbi:hypothetical protein CU633_20690 [Bacillus sp. V3-13]|uniref:tetratricopeptide repeat protein n=1 Tax=Bacillus sp. V3-13 TaxID=2053728 RepID=UPI000C771F38|nr:tetratricopeptide repeat protein [Bacillus sp. V3-13]PLR75477.1 hypothetical protein CU633_20690 [Bacillus sp. V3-13]
MKKSNRPGRDENIILFPDLEKRLIEKGLDHLQQKKFHDAIGFFTEAKSLDPSNSDVYIGLVLAYFESGQLAKAKELAKEMLNEGIGDYIQIVDLYLMILVQLNEYEEIAATIEVLLQEREIPKDKLEHFSKMLHFSRRMSEGRADETMEDALNEESMIDELNLFSSRNPKDQMLLIAKLANRNIRPYAGEITDYLRAEEGHPFLKTMLLNLLTEHEYEKEVLVQKFGRSMTVNPEELGSVQNQEGLINISQLLREKLENDDPVLFENIKSLLERHSFLLYPFEFEPEDPRVWAAAYHFISLKYHGVDRREEDIAAGYGADRDAMEAALEFILMVEEISYPII